MRKGMLQARLRERLQVPLADCIFNLIEGSYGNPSSWQKIADIVTT